MYDKKKFGHILIPIVTPYAKDQSVDHGLLAALATHLVDTGRADTLILSGTTGEFHTQTFAERVAIFETVKKAVEGPRAADRRRRLHLDHRDHRPGQGKPKSSASTRPWWSRPYYTKPSQVEIYGHFAAVAEAVPAVDFMLYNIPIFTGVNVDPATVGKLAEYKNIVAIKEEAELNPKQMTAFINATPEEFIIYNGDDTMVLEAFTQGGDKRVGGVVSGASHVVGDYIRTMIDTFLAGKVEEAADMQAKLYPLLKVMGLNGRTNPVSLWKEAIRLTGGDAGIPRLPLTPGTPEEIEAVRKALVAFGAL